MLSVVSPIFHATIDDALGPKSELKNREANVRCLTVCIRMRPKLWTFYKDLGLAHVKGGASELSNSFSWPPAGH